jgi:hypothetical protein
MLLRISVALLPGFLCAAGIALLIASPLAWGAGADAGLSDWQPPLVGAVFALPAIVVGWMTLRAVGRKTHDRVLIHPVPLTFGVLFMFGGSVVVWGLVGSLPDPATYDALIEPAAVSPDGPPGFAAAQRGVQFQEGMSEAGFLAIALPLGALMFAFVWAASYAYTTAFQADPLMRFEARQAREVDAVGMLLRGERGTRGDQ